MAPNVGPNENRPSAIQIASDTLCYTIIVHLQTVQDLLSTCLHPGTVSFRDNGDTTGNYTIDDIEQEQGYTTLDPA